MMINQQYPGSNFLYAHTFAPPTGHIPQYDHSPAASHQSDSVNIDSQPVSINNQHPGNMPLNQMPAPTVISTAANGTTNVHHLNNGPIMDGHMSNRLPLNQQTYMIPNHYIPQNPFNVMLSYPITNLNYPGGHISAPSPAMIPPIRVPGEIGIRPQYDPQSQTAPIQNATALSQSTVTKPPVAMPPPSALATPTTPMLPIKPREKKALAIVDPLTKHVFTVDELKGSPTTPQSQSSKDSGPPRISPKDILISEKESISKDDTTTRNASDSASIDMVPAEDSKPERIEDSHEERLEPSTKDEPSKTATSPADQTTSATIINASPTSITTPTISTSITDSLPVVTTTSATPVHSTPASIVEERIRGNGDLKSIAVDETDLCAEIVKVAISDDKSSEEIEISEDTPVKKRTLPNLPYLAGQYSPLNPNGSRKYTIEFMKAVAHEMKIDLGSSSAQDRIIDFAPHYVNQNTGGGYRSDYSSSQPLMRRSSQQVIAKPRRVITTHSLQQEVELKTAEKPWKPELEEEKTTIVETGEVDTKRLLKVFRGHLNKLTPQKYDTIIEKIDALDLDGAERLNSVIDLVFDKAVDEPGFCELYARMCKVIAAKDSQFCFHLVKKCQEEFETSDLYGGLNVEDRKIEIEKEPDSAKKKLIYDELYEEMRLRRKKYLGTIKLIGEMYKLGLLLPKIIGLCMTHLIAGASNENIECLCSLIATVGAKMATEREDAIKSSLKNTLTVLQELAYSKKSDELFNLESRIKFKIQDTIDLSRRNWKPRMVENNPKKIEEIREEAREEVLRQQHHNHSSQVNKNSMKPDERNRRQGSLFNNSSYKNPGSRW